MVLTDAGNTTTYGARPMVQGLLSPAYEYDSRSDLGHRRDTFE